jgi:hypothetical protein
VPRCLEVVVRVGLAGDRLARSSIQFAEHRRREEEVGDVFGLLVQDLRGQVVGEIAVRRRNLVEVGGCIVPVANRQTCELQASRPPLGPTGEQRHSVAVEGSAQPCEQCSCLVVVEGELLVADLGKSAFHAPAMQRQWRLAATRQYHAMGWGEPLDEGGEQRPQRFVGSIVEVVDDDDEGLGDGAEFVAEDTDGSESHLTVEFDPVERVVAERRFDDAERRDQRGPEPQRVGVAVVAGHPRTSHCLSRCRPRRQQH